MSESRSQERKGVFSTVLLGALTLMALYLFASGPVTRWFPNAAETIYAPLSPLAEGKLTGPAMRGWLRLWGVNTGE